MDVVQGKMLKKMVGENEVLSRKSRVDLSRIPPYHDSLIPHLERVNHRMAGYLRAADAIWEAPKPNGNGQGWVIGDQGILEPVWSIGPILPSSLVDILDETKEEQDNEESGEEEINEDNNEIDLDLLVDDSY